MIKYVLDTKLDYLGTDVVYQLNRLRSIRQPHLSFKHVEDEFRTLAVYFRKVRIFEVNRAEKQLNVTFTDGNEDMLSAVNDILSTLSTGKEVLTGWQLVDRIPYDNTL